MFRIAKVIKVKSNKIITVVCPEIAGSLEFDVKPMRTPGLWRSPNKDDSVVILGEANNYLYAGRSDDAETYDVLITYLGDGVPDAMVPIWELIKPLFAFLFDQFNGAAGHTHAVAGAATSPVGIVTTDPAALLTNVLDVENDTPAAKYIRIQGNDL